MCVCWRTLPSCCRSRTGCPSRKRLLMKGCLQTCSWDINYVCMTVCIFACIRMVCMLCGCIFGPPLQIAPSTHWHASNGGSHPFTHLPLEPVTDELDLGNEVTDDQPEWTTPCTHHASVSCSSMRVTKPYVAAAHGLFLDFIYRTICLC